jgi:hypothetical protein
MSIDFDVLTDENKFIDRYSIKWLYNYDSCSFLNSFFGNKNIITSVIISYCDKQINELEKETNKFQKIEQINYLEFGEKKEYLINLINNTNNNEEIDEIIKKIHTVINDQEYSIYLNDLKSLEQLINHFKSFKLFLKKYQGNRWEISY